MQNGFLVWFKLSLTSVSAPKSKQHYVAGLDVTKEISKNKSLSRIFYLNMSATVNNKLLAIKVIKC